MYSGANRVFLAGHVQVTVPAAGGDQHSARAVIIPTFGIHDLEIASCARLRRQHFDAETLGVLPHLICELSGLDALGEPWVVVDCLSDSCLSSNTDTLDNQCSNSFTRRIHRRRKAGSATADHDQIVGRLGSLRVDSQLLGQLSIAWFNQNRTILEKNDCRDDLLTIVGVLDVLASGLVLTNVHQL